MLDYVVVTPTAYRAEFLALALEKLALVPDCPPVHIFADTVGSDQLSDIRFVHKTYLSTANLHFQPEHVSTSSGCWNILKSIEYGASISKNVILVEEDVMMKPEAFSFHKKSMDSGEWASCGRRCPRFFARYGDIYTNPGSCLSRPLLDALLPHINQEYFSDTGAYIRNYLGGAITSSLDDGLIRCVIREHGKRSVYNDTPLCAHQGFDYYDEIDIYSNRGSIEERIAGLRKIIAKIKPTDRYAGDFETF